ncbi:phage head closure protein [Malikia sp.]|uniref:phage head closure protein n=1 Tax=Malikia sp. TaxID=2070706 RepID=UPI0026282EA4|nr:phage head closure protein [Malikia sp.]MDD2728176.1 phage head closure protein [Malikia sp.]
MRASDLRHQVTLQRRDTTRDTTGGQVTSWTDVCTTRAGIAALSGRELQAAQAIHAEVTHSVTLRYRPEFVNPTQAAALRLLFKGRVFNIAFVDNLDERRREINLVCSEGLNDG